MRRLLALSPRAARCPAQAEPLAQQYDRANGGGFQVSLGPQRSQRSSEASSTIHCTSSSNVARKRLRVLAQMTSRSCRAGCWPQGRRPPVPSMRSLKAEIRNSARPGSQAPHAPPALTFGLPGKQRVNEIRAGRVLARFPSSLAGNVKILLMEQFRRIECSADVAGPRRALPYFWARFAASAIWSCRKSANAMP